ncbi:5'-methylthioadenosine/adenosylhomocysteine nucleosidase [Entomospira entomophila]|uniref:adenosylhomocysteine nucleosidase n=1 Tax=Entomospira entomophila TaxID=2719988 RepID=A0A968KVJ6_9SPIO|nr:5'-methylthioadenosine/adenosylhomocysteine nucleosidase [Entomospira entomophilus]NIZ39915.1 5'-methylthioadenosine/adenosylhomocysteine nucleosidase [Entomospira entomophilus]WDI35477.1 5'-methylthioadenosine/adenosylhomocysteine nucleosidase [Entomospira entomophilus]
MTRVLILAAMDIEYQFLYESLENIEERHITPWLMGHDGYLSGIFVTIMKMGIAKVNAAVVTGLALQSHDYDLVINTGVAGGIDTALEVGDVVMSDMVTYHDVDVRAFGYVLGQIPGADPIFHSPNRRFLSNYMRGLDCEREYQVVSGLIVSGDQFIGSAEQLHQIHQNFPSALAVEMEGAAVAHVATLFEVPFVVVRAISDKADGQAPMTYEEFLELASRRSSQIVRELLDVASQKSS